MSVRPEQEESILESQIVNTDEQNAICDSSLACLIKDEIMTCGIMSCYPGNLNFLVFPHYLVSFPLPETSREVMLVGEYAHNCTELHKKAPICVRQNVLLPRPHSLRGPDSNVVILPQLS